MNKRFAIGIIASTFIIGAIAAFALLRKPETQEVQTAKLQVAASFYPLAYFAQQIGGDKALVVNITPAGAEPHDYEPTAQDIAAIQRSALLILNGGNLEVWGEEIKKNLNPSKTTIIVAGEGLTTKEVVEEGETITDPHVWLSPALALQMVDKIAEGFTKADPAQSDYYRTQQTALKAELLALDREYKDGLKTCEKKDIVTAHAAFGYLAATYGLNQVSIAGVSTDAEPSPRALAEVTQFAKKNDIKFIFFETLLSPKLALTIAREVGAQTLVLNPLEGLSGEERAARKNYFTEMRSNLVNLKTALQCRT